MIMDEKVILILVDGFRPDALTACGHPYVDVLLSKGSYTLNATTVFPSITLPCHMSLFHSVTPERHGILSNIYTPQVRPIDGLCEQLSKAGKQCAFFYNWEELRDLSRPQSLAHSYYVSENVYPRPKANEMVTKAAIQFIREEAPDFSFVYLGRTDEDGHQYGWMSQQYMDACVQSVDEIQRIVEAFSKDYTIIITADHGGHGRNHGTMDPEDMHIPLICIGKKFKPAFQLENINICDIAPTVVELVGAEKAKEWEGKSILER